jgi:fructan beta-fructosidase
MFIADYQYYCGVCRFAPVDFDIVILMLQISARTAMCSMPRRARTVALCRSHAHRNSSAQRCAVKLLVTITLTVAAVAAAGAPAPTGGDAEQFRPQYHFSPSRHWMNDPNGMVYLDDEYHLFFQYNPDAEVWGPMHWGHAVSTDMLHWRELPIALRPDEHGTIFSGSVVADLLNTSGLGAPGRVPLIALFTSHDEAAKRAGRVDFQTQGMAYSLDKGRTWTKYAGNPVLPNPGLRDFRDPKVSWFEPQNKWVMTLVAGDHVSFYSSKDLRAWRHESDFGQQWGAHGGVWECPDLMEMRVDGESARKYVLLVSVNPGAPNGGSGTQYFVGEFDGHRFVLDEGWQRRLRPAPTTNSPAAAWVDYGADDYAGVTWSNLPRGRRVFLGWMSNWRYAQQVPTQTWRSAMTLPRDLTLVRSPRGLELRAMPIAEVTGLRRASVRLPAQLVRTELDMTGGLKANAGRLELNLTVDTAASDSTAVTFSNAVGESTVFRINRAQHRYELDRSRSGTVDFHPQFADMQSAPLPAGATITRLRVWLDHSSLEIFINEGETVLTAIEFPATPYTRIGLEADAPIEM